MNSETKIMNLLYRYGLCIDQGRFDEAAALFKHGQIAMGEGHVISDAKQIAAMWHGMVRIYECGSSRTRHIITNPIIEIDEDFGVAQVLSCWTVIQQTPDFPLQVVASGRYEDDFHKIEGEWCFKQKRYLGIDLMGDMSAHILGGAPS